MNDSPFTHGPSPLSTSLGMPAALDDQQLLAELERLVRTRQALAAELLVYLGEVDRRKLYLEHACSSMFSFCTERLGMAEPTAYKYIRVARLAREVPLVLEFVADGRLHLTGLKLLAPYVEPDTARELLEAAAGRSKRDIERLLAERFPQPDVPSLLRKLPEPRRARVRELDPEPVPERRREPEPAGPEPDTASPSTVRAGNHSPAERSPTPAPEPLGPERYKVQFTASRSLHDKLRQAQALLRHRVPDGDLAQICERALDLLLAELLRRKFGQSNKAGRSSEAQGAPRRAAAEPSAEPSGQQRTRRRRPSRHIPNAVKRAVFERDGLRCTFVDEQGRRCRETGGLEFHHRRPLARGGRATADNLELRCRAHNRHAAEQDYGGECVGRCIARSRQRPRAASPAMVTRPRERLLRSMSQNGA